MRQTSPYFRPGLGRAFALLLLLCVCACRESEVTPLSADMGQELFPEANIDSLSPEMLEGLQAPQASERELRESPSAWIRIPREKLPSFPRPALFLGQCFHIKQVTVGRSRLFQAPLEAASMAASMKTPYINVPESGDLYLQVLRSPRKGLAIDCRELSIGSEPAILRRLLSLQALEFATGLALAFFGITGFMTFFLYRHPIVFTYSAFCLTLGASLFLLLQPIHLLFSNNREILRLWHLCATAMPGFLMLLLHLILGRRFIFIFILALCNFALAGIDLILLANDSAYAGSAPAHIFMTLQQATIMPFVAGRLIYRNNAEHRIFGIGILLLCLGLLGDNISILFDLRYPVLSGSAGLVFLILTGVALMRHYLRKNQVMEYERRQSLEEYNERLESEVKSREEKLTGKNILFERSNIELEEKNTLLRLSYKRMDDLIHQQDALLKQAAVIKESHLRDLNEGYLALQAEPSRAALHRISVTAHQLASFLEPFARLYRNIEAISSKTIWILEERQSVEAVYRQTLGGSKVNLVSFASEAQLLERLASSQPQLIILSSGHSALAARIHELHPDIPFILSASEDFARFIEPLSEHPFLNHILFHDAYDPVLAQLNLLVTSTKILSNDIFGLEKYIHWGVDIKERIITGSDDRREALLQLDKDLEKAGLSSSIIRAAHRICDEFLMNAIYDAPVDRSTGQSRYNHLSRQVAVELEPSEYARLRYGFDGSLLAMSIDDPFGGLKRETILRYLKSCFDGNYSSINVAEGKGGGGMGLYQILSSADLLVTNIKPGLRTELIALISTKTQGRAKTGGFHYFMERWKGRE